MIWKHFLALAPLLCICGHVLSADDLSNNDDLVSHYLEQHNRTALETDVDLLAKQTLSTEQIERIIEADKTETDPARRLVHWRVLHEAQSPIGHKYLKETLVAADLGQAIAFVQSLRFLRGQDIPLLTSLYEQSESDLLRNALASIAQADPRKLNGSRLLLIQASPYTPYSRNDIYDKKYHEFEDLAEKAIFLYQQWLVENATNNEHRRAVYTSVSPYDHISFLHHGLRREKDADVRRTIYEVLVDRSPGGELLHLLDSDESESTKLACMKLSLLQIRSYKASRGEPPHYIGGLAEILQEMTLDSPALEDIKAKLIEAASPTDDE